MQGGLIETLQMLAPMVASLMMFAVFFLLWSKSRSVWLMLAMLADMIGFAFMAILRVAPGLAQSTPIFFPLWTLSGFVVALGLLAYAIEASRQPSA